MKPSHDHSDHVSGCQTVTGAPDDGCHPVRGQESIVGGHYGIVINDDPYGIKASSREGMHKNPAPNPGSSREPSRDDVVIQTNIPNKRTINRR